MKHQSMEPKKPVKSTTFQDLRYYFCVHTPNQKHKPEMPLLQSTAAGFLSSCAQIYLSLPFSFKILFIISH